MVGSEGPTKNEEKSMAFDGTGLVAPIVIIVLYAVGILIAYSIVKAAVRNGTIEAYIKLRRESSIRPSEGLGQGLENRPTSIRRHPAARPTGRADQLV